MLLQDCEATLLTLTELKPFLKDPLFYNDILGYSTLFVTRTPTRPSGSRRAQVAGRPHDALPLSWCRPAEPEEPLGVQTKFFIARNPGNLDFFEKSLPPLAASSLRTGLAVDRGAPPGLDRGARDYQRFLETDLPARSMGDWRLGPGLWSRKLKASRCRAIWSLRRSSAGRKHLTSDREEP